MSHGKRDIHIHCLSQWYSITLTIVHDEESRPLIKDIATCSEPGPGEKTSVEALENVISYPMFLHNAVHFKAFHGLSRLTPRKS